MKNYTIFHLHSDLSNPCTTIDSATKYFQYVEKAKAIGCTSMAFSEHGNIFEWYHKKTAIEKAGMKYIHGAEVYITESLDEKIRDNYHCVLMAKNLNGFLELNSIITKSFNRQDGHFYYQPRITFEELLQTSDNILVTTACLGSILASQNESLKTRYVNFLTSNKHRCWLEIQHHNVDEQKEYNRYLLRLSKTYNIPLIAGTDTHSLNKDLADARLVLQKSKNIHFENEDAWDTTLKTYEELLESYRIQDALPFEIVEEALEQTNLLADMVEPFDLDKSPKYPKLYENPEKVFQQKILEAYKSHPYIKRHNSMVIKERIKEEFEVYKQTQTIDFMLFQNYLREWERDNGIRCGYSRGSISGSLIAYILGITEMDSLKFDLNFFRFLNPHRISNCDIDTDYSEEDRDKLKKFLFSFEKLHVSEIITFNTIALKGAIRDVGRAFDIPLNIIGEICDSVEDLSRMSKYREEYPRLFKYVDLLQGVIVSIGNHPAGILISEIDTSKYVGLCTLSSTDNVVSCLNMKELDDLMYVKLDLLGLDNVRVINETCRLAGIERLTPDNTNLEDWSVWESIREDTTAIFQWESDSAQAYLRSLFSDETIRKIKQRIPKLQFMKLFSFGNGLIRPACASYREEVAKGNFYDNGFEALNRFLENTLGYVTMQEDIMMFLVHFCGYSMAESDTVRRGIAKKGGTERFIPEIRERFVKYTSDKYKVSQDKCAEIIEPFIKVILDASAYGFSWNHSDAYSCIGYIGGYLRYYYPLEFITVCLNTFKDKEEKKTKIVEYAKKHNVKILPISFGKSKASYVLDKENKVIYEGISGIKYCNVQIAEELFELAQNNKYNHFLDLLVDIALKTSLNSRQLEILITLNFFEEFGNNQKLLKFVEQFSLFNGAKQIKKDKYSDEILNSLIAKHSQKHTDKLYKDIDYIGLLKDVWNTIENKKIRLSDQAKAELEYLGYVQLKEEKLAKDYYIALELKFGKNKFKPYIKLYNINEGVVVLSRIKDEKLFAERKIKDFDIIKLTNYIHDRKSKLINGEWKKSDETELVLTNYIVI